MRCLVVAAHPDDETLGAASLMARLPPLSIIHLTDGAPRDASCWRQAGCVSRETYAALRRRELESALAEIGVEPEQLLPLGAVGGEATLELPRLARSLSHFIDACAPDLIITHAYEGGHPDHDAAAFIVQAARRLTRLAPRVLEMAMYHAYGKQCFLHGTNAVIEMQLDPEARRRKQRMLACFRSQRRALAGFSPDVERFRVAPDYDFDRPPHAGPLAYEEWGCAIEGAFFRARTREAMLQLGLGETHPVL